MCSSHGDWTTPAGLPHSEIHGSMPAFGYPWHIADRCVLRRLLVPRHSPCTLCSLTCDLSFFTRRKCRFTLFGSFLIYLLFCFTLSSLFSFQGTSESLSTLMVGSSSSHTPLLAYVFLSLAPTEPFGSLVGSSGFEPPTSRLSGVRSNQLSYEPALVEMNGIEPMTPCLQSRCSPS